MKFNQKITISFSDFINTSSTNSTQISENQEDDNSFLKNKDSALSPVDISDEINDPSENENNSPKCQQLSSNMFYYSSMSNNQDDISKAIENLPTNQITIYFEDN